MSAKKKAPAAAPDKPKGPPYAMTPTEEVILRGRFRFTAGEVDFPIEKAKGALDEIASELEGLAERVMHEVNDIDHDGEQGARHRSHALGAFAAQLGALSVRMMRHAGQLEGFAECIRAADRSERMVEAWKKGTLGNPPPPVNTLVSEAP